MYTFSYRFSYIDDIKLYVNNLCWIHDTKCMYIKLLIFLITGVQSPRGQGLTHLDHRGQDLGMYLSQITSIPSILPPVTKLGDNTLELPCPSVDTRLGKMFQSHNWFPYTPIVFNFTHRLLSALLIFSYKGQGQNALITENGKIR